MTGNIWPKLVTYDFVGNGICVCVCIFELKFTNIRIVVHTFVTSFTTKQVNWGDFFFFQFFETFSIMQLFVHSAIDLCIGNIYPLKHFILGE